jgi:hypothetical protein
VTGPYLARVANEIKGSIGHVHTVTIDPVGAPSFDIVAEDVEVTFAEDWSPHVQAKITGPVASVLAELDAMDARRNCRVQISAGYLFEDGTLDVKPLADLGLRWRGIRRPSNETGLTASSDEARAQDRRRAEATGLPVFTGLNAAVQWFADYAMYPETATVVSDFTAATGAVSVAGMEAAVGTTMWDPMEDAAARTGKWLYCTADRIWRIRARPEVGGMPKHTLTVGKWGTIFGSESTLDRTGWANQSIVEYAWTDAVGASQKVYGRAKVTAGPYSVDNVGYCTDHKVYNMPATQAQADATAATRVRSLVTRGRGLSLEAHAAYWLRPGDTITVQLPTGPAEDHIIKSIKFRPVAGSMAIETRQPLDVTITSGE